MPYIYQIKNIINGKLYIGKAKQLNRRWNEHKRKVLNINYRHPLYDGMRKYGIENFSIEILEECSSEIVNDRERYWIAKLSPIYNLTLGGDGGDTFTRKPQHMKDETRKKMSDASKVNWQDEKYRKKLSEALKRNWQKKVYRETITRKAKENAKNPEYLKKVSDGVKKAIKSKKKIWSDCKRGSKNGRWLGRIQMNYPNGSVYKIYESAVDCKRDTGIIANNIRVKALCGEPMLRGKFRGYTFVLLTPNEVV